MSDYLHGAYAQQVDSPDYTSPTGVGTIPVYIGRAPVHQLADSGGKVGVPILLSSWLDAMTKIGYSEDWKDFDLCEAVYAHFRNGIQSIGPIIVINALDPAEDKSSTQQTVTITFVKKAATISSARAILGTVAIEGKVLGTDFSVAYADDGLSVQVRDLTGAMATAQVTYTEVDPDAVTSADIVAAINAGVPMVYYSLEKVPTLLASPGWSSKTDVLASLADMADKINGHWYAWVNADMDASTVKTIPAAITAKSTIDTTAAGVLLWPMAKKGDRLYHLSTLETVTMQRVDFDNDNVPYESPSNKEVDVDSLCLADGSAIQYDQTAANELNANGIDTLTYWEGTWRMWGPHTMKYAVGATINDRDIFDCNVRMMRYVENTFQRSYGDEVDKPMTRGRKDSILNDFQAWLDGLAQDGALLSGSVAFESADNATSDMVQGNFVFETEFTNPVPAKSLTNKVKWTADGLTALFGGES